MSLLVLVRITGCDVQQADKDRYLIDNKHHAINGTIVA